VLCLGDGVIESSRLGRLVQVLRRHYDLVVIDSPRGDRLVTDKAFEASEVNLLVSPPTDEFIEAMQPWFDMAWEQGLVPRLALVINRVSEKPIPKVLLAAFPNHALIPEEPDAGSNVLERPWVLRFESPAGRAIRELVGTLLPLLARRRTAMPHELIVGLQAGAVVLLVLVICA
jgi:MinD-like ATPase involved in chromosome partitioning or flagellar assembly